MNRLSKYVSFVKERGRPLSEINPGSNEVALTIEDALSAIELLQEAKLAILGGDILLDESGKLVYTYENWYCEKIADENDVDYINRSCLYSKSYITNLAKKRI
jgi:hypothetical protein